MERILKRLYTIFCYLYREVITYYQFYKFKNKNNNKLYFKYKFNFPIKQLINDNKFTKVKNKYQNLYIANSSSLYKLIDEIFTIEFRNFLTSQTGFCYSIDYFLFYENLPIPNHKKHLPIYANNMHIDKPYSKNMLKIIIPINVFDHNYGPLIVAKKKGFSSYKGNIKFNEFITFLSVKKNSIAHIFFPSQSFHKACIPKDNYSCLQFMIQLNPSSEWQINTSICNKQYKKEPKFPEINYLFDKKISLKRN